MRPSSVLFGLIRIAGPTWRILAFLVAGAIAIATMAACSGHGSPAAPVVPATAGSPAVPAAGCTPARPVSVDGDKTVNPYAARGARQVPGPGMTDVALPLSPVAVAMERPGDPDANVAARQPDGRPAGPIPSAPQPRNDDPVCEQLAELGDAP